MSLQYFHHSHSHNHNVKNAMDDQIGSQYNYHKEIMKKLMITAKSYQKISRSYFDIKNSMISVREILESQVFNGLSSLQAKCMIQNICQTNTSLADHCHQFSGQIHNLWSMYAELTKIKHQKYQQEKNNYMHYLVKVDSLSKGTHSQKDKYQRNKEKLNAARKQYEARSKEISVFLGKVNEQAQKIWQKNFISFVSIFISKYNEILKITKQLLQNKQLILKPIQSDQLILDEDQFQFSLKKLKSQNQLSNYQTICSNVEKYLMKYKGPTQKILISQAFNKKQQTIDIIDDDDDDTHANQHKNNKSQKLFGINSLKINTTTKQFSNELTKSFNFNQKLPIQKNQIKKNDFSQFQNLLSENRKTDAQKTNLQIHPKSFVSKPVQKKPLTNVASKNDFDNLFGLQTFKKGQKTVNQINLLDL